MDSVTTATTPKMDAATSTTMDATTSTSMDEHYLLKCAVCKKIEPGDTSLAISQAFPDKPMTSETVFVLGCVGMNFYDYKRHNHYCRYKNGPILLHYKCALLVGYPVGLSTKFISFDCSRELSNND